ncbi:hypothetical protein ACJX0J_006213 [Zea mays]
MPEAAMGENDWIAGPSAVTPAGEFSLLYSILMFILVGQKSIQLGSDLTRIAFGYSFEISIANKYEFQFGVPPKHTTLLSEKRPFPEPGIRFWRKVQACAHEFLDFASEGKKMRLLDTVMSEITSSQYSDYQFLIWVVEMATTVEMMNRRGKIP